MHNFRVLFGCCFNKIEIEIFLPAPPTYAEAVQNEKFEYNLDEGGNNNGGNTNLGFSGNNGPLDDQANVAGTSSPLASAPHPPGYDYVPNYITYGFSKGK